MLRKYLRYYFLTIFFRVPFQPTGTNIVTNTAPTPGVRMRVVRRNGETATMVGLGEDLQLRIEIDQVKNIQRCRKFFLFKQMKHVVKFQ